MTKLAATKKALETANADARRALDAGDVVAATAAIAEIRRLVGICKVEAFWAGSVSNSVASDYRRGDFATVGGSK